MDNATAALARMNMILHDCPTAEIWKDNTLAAPHFKGPDGGLKTFDFAVANPPFSTKAWSNGLDVANDLYGQNLHLGVYPPHGWVRVAAPLAVSDEAVRLAVIGKLDWIERQRARFAAQPRQSRREMVSGESHYFLGRRYRLRVHEGDGAARVALRGATSLDLFVRPGMSAEQRELVLQRWYREQLKALIPPLLDKWQPALGVQAAQWGIKRMKTKWGSCNIGARRIWLNLELAKKPQRCLEFVVVHELVHLLERHHNARFTGLMDHYLPTWRVSRDELNQAPLGHEDWGAYQPQAATDDHRP